MSTLGSIYRAIRSLLLAEECIVCGNNISHNMHGICTMCRFNVPLTYFWRDKENPVYEKLSALVPIAEASAFIYYTDKSPWRSMIHSFKYRNAWRTALDMGRWYGAELKASGRYDDIDIIIPVPLHPLKRIRRGYNQSSYIADGISQSLGKRVLRRATRRTRNNPSQTHHRAHDRWGNVEALFSVTRPEELAGKHILIVDDVLTTGATMISLIQSILETVPDCRISVATLAVTTYITAIR